MSLLHDALKKAEKEAQLHDGGHVMVDTERTHHSPSIRRIVLTTLLISSILFAIGLRLYNKRAVTAAPAPKTFTTPLQIAGGPSPAKLAEEAMAMSEAGNFEEAKTRWERLVILEPRNAEAYNNLGYVLKKLGQNEKAFEQYQKALSINPQCAECLNNLGALYLSNRDLTEAEAQFQKAIQAKADYAAPYFHLALLMEARGDLGGAKRNYLKYLDLAQNINAEMLLKIQKRVAGLKAP